MEPIHAVNFLSMYNSDTELNISLQVFFLTIFLILVFFLQLIVLLVRTRREYLAYKRWVERKQVVFADMTLQLMDPMVLIFGTLNRMEQLYKGQKPGVFGLLKKNIQEVLDQTYNLHVLSELEDQAGKRQYVYGEMRTILQGYLNQQQLFAAETGKTLVLHTSFQQYFMDFEAEVFEKIFHQFLHLLIYTSDTPLIDIQADIVSGGGAFGNIEGLESNKNYLLVMPKISGGVGEMTNFSALDEKDRLFFLGRSNRNVVHLALYIMDYLMDKIGGKVLYKADSAGIASVVLFFPIIHQPRVSREAVLSLTDKLIGDFPDRERQETIAAGQKNILVVESDNKYGQQLKALLEPEFSISVIDAKGANLDLLAGMEPGLVLIGEKSEQYSTMWDFCKKLRNSSGFQEIPILQLLDQNDPEVKIRGLKNGVSAFLTKPILAEELLLHVKKLIAAPGAAWGQESEPSRASEKEKTKVGGVFMERFRAVVEKNISNTDFRIEDLCKAMHMSHSKLHRKTVHASGFTPQQVIRQMRLDYAVGQLKNPELNINQVALNAGFEDPGYFTRVFKREKGLTPTEWREQYGDMDTDYSL